MADMTLSKKTRTRLAERTETRKQAEGALNAAVVGQYTAIREAVAGGASLREVAAVVDLSHQMVHKIVEGKT